MTWYAWATIGGAPLVAIICVVTWLCIKSGCICCAPEASVWKFGKFAAEKIAERLTATGEPKIVRIAKRERNYRIFVSFLVLIVCCVDLSLLWSSKIFSWDDYKHTPFFFFVVSLAISLLAWFGGLAITIYDWKKLRARIVLEQKAGKQEAGEEEDTTSGEEDPQICDAEHPLAVPLAMPQPGLGKASTPSPSTLEAIASQRQCYLNTLNDYSNVEGYSKGPALSKYGNTMNSQPPPGGTESRDNMFDPRAGAKDDTIVSADGALPNGTSVNVTGCGSSFETGNLSLKYDSGDRSIQLMSEGSTLTCDKDRLTQFGRNWRAKFLTNKGSTVDVDVPRPMVPANPATILSGPVKADATGTNPDPTTTSHTVAQGVGVLGSQQQNAQIPGPKQAPPLPPRSGASDSQHLAALAPIADGPLVAPKSTANKDSVAQTSTGPLGHAGSPGASKTAGYDHPVIPPSTGASAHGAPIAPNSTGDHAHGPPGGSTGAKGPAHENPMTQKSNGVLAQSPPVAVPDKPIVAAQSAKNSSGGTSDVAPTNESSGAPGSHRSDPSGHGPSGVTQPGAAHTAGTQQLPAAAHPATTFTQTYTGAKVPAASTRNPAGAAAPSRNPAGKPSGTTNGTRRNKKLQSRKRRK